MIKLLLLRRIFHRLLRCNGFQLLEALWCSRRRLPEERPSQRVGVSVLMSDVVAACEADRSALRDTPMKEAKRAFDFNVLKDGKHFTCSSAVMSRRLS